MSKQSESSINLNKGWLFPLSAFIVCAALSFTGMWSGADRYAYDVLLRAKSRIAPLKLSPRVVSVDITDNTELTNGPALESRQLFLGSLRVMRDAGVGGGFDFLFSASKDPEVDAEMAKTAGEIPRCVMAMVPLSKAETNFSGRELDPAESSIVEKHLWHPKVIREGNVPVAARFLLPTAVLAQSATHLAHVGLVSDPDGIYRRVPLLYRWGTGYVPSLPLAMAADELGIDTNGAVLDAGKALTLPLKKGGRIIVPIDDSGCVYIPYAGQWKDGLKRIPMETFARAASDSATFDQVFDVIDGNILSLCDLSTAKKDFGTTPLEPVYPLSGIHNAVLNGLLTNTFFSPFPTYAKFLLFALALCAVVFGLSRKKAAAFHWTFAIILFAATAVTIALWFVFLIVPWYAGIAVAIVVTWLTAWVFRLAAVYKERLLLGNALSRYFPRSLAEKILKEGRTDLVPATKELTILFADIAGFTKWSSDKSPEMVHGFLSEYLESMAGIIFAHGGTVDKFMGDGILAFFGDPFEQPDHAARCVGAAIAMQRKVRELAEKWRPIVGIELKIRIGINTGKVIVGNLGSKTRIEYTVIGATVNLAQRMEGGAPVGGIMLAEDAYRDVEGRFEFDDPQAITVKGYERPINAYTVKNYL